jgi:hypothetical protein
VVMVVQHGKHTESHFIVHSKVIKIVNFMLCKFYPNKKCKM